MLPDRSEGFFARRSAEAYESEAVITPRDPGQAFPVFSTHPNPITVAAGSSCTAWHCGNDGRNTGHCMKHRSDSGWLSFRCVQHQSLEKRIVVHPCVERFFSPGSITIKMAGKRDDRAEMKVFVKGKDQWRDECLCHPKQSMEPVVDQIFERPDPGRNAEAHTRFRTAWPQNDSISRGGDETPIRRCGQSAIQQQQHLKKL
jgi:hypothetical protein